MVGRRGKQSARFPPGGRPAVPDIGRGARDKKAAGGARTSHFRSGLAVDDPRKRIYSLDVDRGTISALDLETLKELKSTACGTRPYDVVLARNGLHLYVSDWAGRSVRVVEPGELHTVARIAVGEHPTQIAIHPADDRMFVACASSNCVSVIDTRRGIVTETISTGLFPLAPEGSTPDALAVAPDGKTLFVANADNNNVAVIDIATPGRSQVKGFIPTGWYPTAVAVTPDGKQLLDRRGQGPANQGRIRSTRQSRRREPGHHRRRPFPYIGTTLSGSLSIVPVPDDKALAAYTETVYKNCPYSDKLLTDAPYPEKTAIPTKVGDPSPIKYVLYIIKENRTYDQVFGDMPRGNGDPALVMFGERRFAQPSQAGRGVCLARQPLLQRARVGRRAPVVDDGLQHRLHRAELGLDVLEPGRNSRRRRRRPHQCPLGLSLGCLRRAGLSYRSYGEYGRRVSQPDGSLKIEGAVPGPGRPHVPGLRDQQGRRPASP